MVTKWVAGGFGVAAAVAAVYFTAPAVLWVTALSAATMWVVDIAEGVQKLRPPRERPARRRLRVRVEDLEDSPADVADADDADVGGHADRGSDRARGEKE